MSSTFLIVNVDKRQYLDPSEFGESDTSNGYMQGFHAIAVALLVCDPGGYSMTSPLGGTWCRDRVLAVYDSTPPGSFGVTTSIEDRPNRNLYELSCEEFENISHGAIAIVCNWIEGAADVLVSRILITPHDGQETLNEHLFLQLGCVAIDLRCKTLDEALNRKMGFSWRSKFEEVKQTY